MSIWDEFSDEELYTILECRKFKDVEKKIKRKFDRDEWIRAARSSYVMQQQNKLIMQSFLYAVKESANYSFLVLLGVIGSITVALLPLSIMTAVLAVVAISSGAFFFTLSHRAIQRARENIIKQMDFRALILLCANEIITRKNIQLASSLRDTHAGVLIVPPPPEPEFKYKLKNREDHVKEAAVFGMGAGALAFGTYFAGLAILLHAFGLVAISGMMLGPIGMAVSLAAAIGIGVICACAHYQTVKKQDAIAQFSEFQIDLIADKRAECHALKKKTKHLALPSKLKHSLSDTSLQANSLRRSCELGQPADDRNVMKM